MSMWGISGEATQTPGGGVGFILCVSTVPKYFIVSLMSLKGLCIQIDTGVFSPWESMELPDTLSLHVFWHLQWLNLGPHVSL